MQILLENGLNLVYESGGLILREGVFNLLLEDWDGCIFLLEGGLPILSENSTEFYLENAGEIFLENGVSFILE